MEGRKVGGHGLLWIFFYMGFRCVSCHVVSCPVEMSRPSTSYYYAGDGVNLVSFFSGENKQGNNVFDQSENC